MGLIRSWLIARKIKKAAELALMVTEVLVPALNKLLTATDRRSDREELQLHLLQEADAIVERAQQVMKTIDAEAEGGHLDPDNPIMVARLAFKEPNSPIGERE